MNRNSIIFIHENAIENVVCQNGGRFVKGRRDNNANAEDWPWSFYDILWLVLSGTTETGSIVYKIVIRDSP